MTENSSVTLQALLQFALPWGTTLVTDSPEKRITWAVMVRAQPPAFPDVSGGELALVSMDLLRTYDTRITLAEVVRGLSEVGVQAVATSAEISQTAITVAREAGVEL
ncbi:MAG: hypothetical protein GYB67_02360, partial [Chloroflexi bacterium]|nr:hypothetical protein [Chloroflexota bacterium]